MSILKDPKSESREQELEKLFSNVPYQNEMFVELPSKGKFYKNFKNVKVIPLIFEDEQRIIMSKNKNINPVNEILSKCVDGVGVSELLAMDKLFLLMKIKEISYGPDYKFTVICPNCNENVESSLAIGEIPVSSVPDDLEDPREVILPMLKVSAKIRFPRSVDEHYFNDPESTINNLYRLVVSLNGNEDSIFISKAIKKMHIRDIKTIEKEINRKEFGINTSFQFECPHCKHNAILGIPFDANFFSVN